MSNERIRPSLLTNGYIVENAVAAATREADTNSPTSIEDSAHIVLCSQCSEDSEDFCKARVQRIDAVRAAWNSRVSAES